MTVLLSTYVRPLPLRETVTSSYQSEDKTQSLNLTQKRNEKPKNHEQKKLNKINASLFIYPNWPTTPSVIIKIAEATSKKKVAVHRCIKFPKALPSHYTSQKKRDSDAALVQLDQKRSNSRTRRKENQNKRQARLNDKSSKTPYMQEWAPVDTHGLMTPTGWRRVRLFLKVHHIVTSRSISSSC